MPNIVPATPVTTIKAETNSAQAFQSPVQPTPPVEPVVEAKKEEIPDQRLMEYTRREKAILAQKRALQQKEQELKQYDPWREAAQLAQTDKLKAIQRLGISYDELTNAYLGQQNWTPEQIAAHRAEQVAEEKFKSFEQKQLEAARQAQSQQYQQALTQITADVKAIAETSQNYPLVKTLGAYDNVTKRIEEEFHRTGRVMSTEEALRFEEQEMEEVAYELAQVEKIRNRFNPQNSPQQPAPQQINTLTHKTTMTAPPNKPLSSAEKRQRAIDIFHGRMPG